MLDEGGYGDACAVQDTWVQNGGEGSRWRQKNASGAIFILNKE